MTRHAGPDHPAVSVVMCVFAPDARFFPKAVQSVLSQTLRQVELIVIEDPSSQRGRSMLSDVRDARLRYYSNRRRTSLVEQRNRGIFEARAPLIAILDCDDVAEPERLERQVAVFEGCAEVDLLGSAVTVINERDEVIGHRCFPLVHDEIRRAMHRIVPFCHPSIMFRKSAVLCAGGYQNTFGPLVDDYDLYSRLVLSGHRSANHPSALTQYRLHRAQTKARQLKETIRAVLRVKSRYWTRSMDAGDLLRMFAESCLLVLPERFILELLKKVHYSGRAPKASLGDSDAVAAADAQLRTHIDAPTAFQLTGR